MSSQTRGQSPMLAWLVVIAGVATLAYLPGLSGGFLFDDFPNIVTNPRIHADGLSQESLAAAARAYEPGPYGRPLATIGFALDHYLGGGDPIAFKLHGLLVHLLNSLLVFALARRLLRIAKDEVSVEPKHRSTAAAAVLAIAWAIHPLQVSSVLYVVQRMETLASCFVLLALLTYVGGRIRQIDGRAGGWSMVVASGVFAAIGLLAKESAIIAPLLALTIEACLFRFRAAVPADRRLLRTLWLICAAVGLAGFTMVTLHYTADGAYSVREYGPWERLLTQPRVLVLYLSQILLPLPSAMPFYYDNFAHSTGLFTPWTTAASALLLAALAGIALWLRPRLPLAALGIFWFFAAHALTSGVIPLEHVYEHRNYLALFGILLAILAAALRLLPRLSSDGMRRLVAGAVLAGLFVITLIRAMTWGSPLVLATDMVANNPASPRASNDLATLYFSLAEGDPASREWGLAQTEFRRGAALPGSSPLAEHGLILMNASAGLPAEPEWWDSLIHKLRHRAISPQETMAVTGLLSQRQRGFLLDDQRLSEAYRVLVERSELSAHAYCNIGDHALNQVGDIAFGTRMFATCIHKAGFEPSHVERTVSILRSDGHAEVADALISLQAAHTTPARP